jgi:hypothetical protein
MMELAVDGGQRLRSHRQPGGHAGGTEAVVDQHSLRCAQRWQGLVWHRPNYCLAWPEHIDSDH